MPYRRAHYWLLSLFPLAGLAFWPAYVADLPGAPWAFHAHGATATLWLGLLIFQSWSIHRRRNALHRSAGLASLALFPLFAAGGLLVIQTMAAKFAARSDPFYALFGARLGLLDSLATLGMAWLFFMALKSRRKVHPHARYMLGTAFFLIAPVLSRLLPILPPLAMSGPADFHRFGYGLHLANGLAIAIALHLWRRAPAHGRPWLIVAGLVAAQSLLFEFAGRTAAWQALFVAVAAVPAPLVAGAGFALGAAAAWFGWHGAAGRRPGAGGAKGGGGTLPVTVP
jgi:hypothetical protein